MENIIKSVVIFAAGASAGAIVTWKLIKEKYKKLAQEEIDSVKELYSEKISKVLERTEPLEEGAEEQIDETIVNEYNNMCSDLGYSSASTREKKEDKVLTKPYVISPDEFGEQDYNIISLNYYADGVLADDFDVIIDDVEATVGEDSLNHFGEYEDDSVFVRNDELEIDYEILKDTRKFEEIADKQLYPGDDE